MMTEEYNYSILSTHHTLLALPVAKKYRVGFNNASYTQVHIGTHHTLLALPAAKKYRVGFNNASYTQEIIIYFHTFTPFLSDDVHKRQPINGRKDVTHLVGVPP